MTETEQEYFQICAWRFLHPLPKTEYGEVHHILPKSCGGMNNVFNLVRLTPEEHYRCHFLLMDIFQEKGNLDCFNNMALATHLMSKTRKGIRLSETEYGDLRREFAKAVSAKMSGKPSPFKGKHRNYSDDTKRRMGSSNRGKTTWNKGKHHSIETRKKIAEKARNRKPRKLSLEHRRKLKECAKLQWAKVKAAGRQHL